jgi:hypothetical protein
MSIPEGKAVIFSPEIAKDVTTRQTALGRSSMANQVDSLMKISRSQAQA